ncbi:hypothetical protein Q9R08_17620 [Microbacterium sp. QXD-8]|uniref:Uncharacterized protein n=1 Tax=Microbacterium psychrotolerans TaxID=3068321 RepID=A0ABU0Z5E0_9MICO|nr:hypothetical protein [Microbacterium sp. QXD-8]MDQ7879814.1 hypothetical protein [Microbacterium sp. QXD-8]
MARRAVVVDSGPDGLSAAPVLGRAACGVAGGPDELSAAELGTVARRLAAERGRSAP